MARSATRRKLSQFTDGGQSRLGTVCVCVCECVCGVYVCAFNKSLRSDYTKQARDQFLRIRLKIAKKCCLYLDIFSCVEINVFRSFFAFRREMRVRCDNQYENWSRRGEVVWNSQCCLSAWVSVF